MQLKKIILYREPQVKNLREAQLKRYVEEKLSVPVEMREEFFSYWLGKLSCEHKSEKVNFLARRLAKIRVKDPSKMVDTSVEPFQIEVNYEKNNLINSLNKKAGILYEGRMFVSVMRSLIDTSELCPEFLHIVFTNQLFATWEGRYHTRAILCASPSAISTSGLVEGPAKPREFYLLKKQYLNLGRGNMMEDLEGKFGEEILHPDDKRITEVAKGYTMQAVFYHLTGEPFCSDPGCRAYNAHWQKELLQAQLHSPYEFCSNHQRILGQK